MARWSAAILRGMNACLSTPQVGWTNICIDTGATRCSTLARAVGGQKAMKQRGRVSAAALSVIGVEGQQARPSPPACLSGARIVYRHRRRLRCQPFPPDRPAVVVALL